ncbi:MAG: branched-chain amino acid ABC transporter permease [Dehalococcoidales bacterium]|jgi:branched-chain amino acid transport system permease protein|nr:branched-chain amino acid ABC transporter permease [Dehalococcoidales bacterium]
MEAIIVLNKQRLLHFTPYIAIGLFLITATSFLDIAVLSLLTKILIFALLAMSLDLIWGYTGLWSLGHASLFGMGAYTTGILMVRYGITSLWLSAPAGILMTVLVAAIFGLIALRVSTVYFLLITFALGQLVYGVGMKWFTVTGGRDGLPGVPYPDLGFPVSFSPISIYYFTLTVVVICAFVLYKITKSPFGHSLQGIRESETRMRHLGYNTWLYKYIAFVVSGLFAGVAGVLHIYFYGHIAPASIGFMASGTAILMVIIGGSGTLWGAAIGAVVINILQYYISIFVPERWPLILGACFIAVVVFLRGGILPHLRRLWMKVEQP